MLRKTILIWAQESPFPPWRLAPENGFTPVLVERAPRFREGGYIIDFWAGGFDVAERMGLVPEYVRLASD